MSFSTVYLSMAWRAEGRNEKGGGRRRGVCGLGQGAGPHLPPPPRSRDTGADGARRTREVATPSPIPHPRHARTVAAHSTASACMSSAMSADLMTALRSSMGEEAGGGGGRREAKRRRRVVRAPVRQAPLFCPPARRRRRAAPRPPPPARRRAAARLRRAAPPRRRAATPGPRSRRRRTSDSPPVAASGRASAAAGNRAPPAHKGRLSHDPLLLPLLRRAPDA